MYRPFNNLQGIKMLYVETETNEPEAETRGGMSKPPKQENVE